MKISAILAGISKEFNQLKRDLGGLALLFLMPAVLVIVMSLLQDAPFKNYQTFSLDIAIFNEDKQDFSQELITGLENSGYFKLTQFQDKNAFSADLNKGRFKVGVYIPKGISADLDEKAELLSQEIMKGFGLSESNPSNGFQQKTKVELWFDPAADAGFRANLHNNLEKLIAQAETNHILNNLFSAMGAEQSTNISNIALTQVEEHSIHESQAGFQLSSVQHNVPAWAIFAMFFIVIPLGGNIIKEKEDGSFVRLRSMPLSIANVFISKMLFYGIICVLQFVFILLIGKFVMPLIGLDAIHFGSHSIWLPLLIVLIALAACAYALLIGGVFSSSHQALSFGSLSVVILAALGGAWIPRYVMPAFLQKLSLFSPFSWAIEASQDLLVRNQFNGYTFIYFVLLLLFAVICSSIGIFAIMKKQNSL